MPFQNNHCIPALNICALSCVMLLLLSCAATVQEGNQSFNGRLLAENSMMKKRLPLIERENDVLKKENQQHIDRIQELETANRQLGLELISLQENLANDKAMSNQEIGRLQDNLQQMEQENSETITALKSQSRNLEAKLTRGIEALNEQLVKQKAAFLKERDQLGQDHAKRELELSTQLAVLKKKLEPKEEEIASLKLAISEISIQLGAATTLSESLRKARDESLAKLESVQAANTKAREQSRAELEAMKAADRKAREKTQAELASVKAANAALNQKIAELSRELPSQGSPGKTDH
jgi:chromosome segregation ATPase